MALKSLELIWIIFLSKNLKSTKNVKNFDICKKTRRRTKMNVSNVILLGQRFITLRIGKKLKITGASAKKNLSRVLIGRKSVPVPDFWTNENQMYISQSYRGSECAWGHFRSLWGHLLSRYKCIIKFHYARYIIANRFNWFFVYHLRIFSHAFLRLRRQNQL